ncbi:MAG: hypothetical protein AAF376_13420 [Pseudomonadota bacterium]
MVRLLVFLVILVALGALGLLGYSYSGYLQPIQTEISVPVELNVD